MRSWWLVGVYVFVSVLGLALIKQVLNGASLTTGAWSVDRLAALLAQPRLVGGALLYGGGFLIWLGILARNDLSVAFPIASSLLYVGILVASALMLGEPLTAQKATGFLLIVGGIYVTATG